jgi:hypothetical protein
MLTNLIDQVTGKALDRLIPVVERKLDELKTLAIAEVEKQIPVLMDKLLALLPMAAASAAAAVANKVLESDPDIPGVSSIFDLSETIRTALNDSTPEGIHIPILSDILKGFGH